jgi:hypothetical protein
MARSGPIEVAQVPPKEADLGASIFAQAFDGTAIHAENCQSLKTSTATLLWRDVSKSAYLRR